MKSTSSSNLETSALVLDSPANKDLLALHNEAWGPYQPTAQPPQSHTQVQNLTGRDTPITSGNNGVSQQPIQSTTPQPVATVGQENIVRVFDELMKNMARMKSFIRPAMCKPYGKQSESLQKSKITD